MCIANNRACDEYKCDDANNANKTEFHRKLAGKLSLRGASYLVFTTSKDILELVRGEYTESE
jgi:hypothetical protein